MIPTVPWRQLPEPEAYTACLRKHLEQEETESQHTWDLEKLGSDSWDDATFDRLLYVLKPKPDLLWGLNCLTRHKYRLECSRTTSEVEFLVIVASDKAWIHSLTSSKIATELPSSDEEFRKIVKDSPEWDALLTKELREQWLASLAEILQEILHHTDTEDDCRTWAQKRLLQLAKENAALPFSMFGALSTIYSDTNGEEDGLTEPVNSGGNCEVYRVRTECSVFCLRALKSNKRSRTDKLAFCSEALVWNQLRHRHIVPLLGVTYVRPYQLAFILPWFRNGCISDFLKTRPTHDRSRAVEQITDAIAYLHGLNPPVIHRDLKAANVLVDDEEICVLSDFGISGITDTLQHSTATGTYLWMPPESLDPSPNPCIRGDRRPRDIYALGCTIYEILTGEIPRLITFNVHKNQEPPIPPPGHRSQEESRLWGIVQQCVAYDPASRPPITEVVKLLWCRPLVQSDAPSSGNRTPEFDQEGPMAVDRRLTGVKKMPSTVDTAVTLRYEVSTVAQDLALTHRQVVPRPTNSAKLGVHKAGYKSIQLEDISNKERSLISQAVPSEFLRRKIIGIDDLKIKDIVIAVMGPARAGKSHFIDCLISSTPGSSSPERSQSVTENVDAIRLRGTNLDRIVLVDMPGFDDTYRSDMDILELIGNWLKTMYKRRIKLAGILYMHRISDNRMAGSPHRNLRMFGELCGDRAMGWVILVTTMWDRLAHFSQGEKREKDLLDSYWSGMTGHGAKHQRFHNSSESAWETLNILVHTESDRRVLLLQEELVKMHKRLNETRAGLALYADLMKLFEKQMSHLQTLENPQADPQRTARLREEHEKTQREMEEIFRQLKKLKISFGRRILLFFNRDSDTHPVEVRDVA